MAHEPPPPARGTSGVDAGAPPVRLTPGERTVRLTPAHPAEAPATRVPGERTLRLSAAVKPRPAAPAIEDLAETATSVPTPGAHPEPTAAEPTTEAATAAPTPGPHPEPTAAGLAPADTHETQPPARGTTAPGGVSGGAPSDAEAAPVGEGPARGTGTPSPSGVSGTPANAAPDDEAEPVVASEATDADAAADGDPPPDGGPRPAAPNLPWPPMANKAAPPNTAWPPIVNKAPAASAKDAQKPPAETATDEPGSPASDTYDETVMLRLPVIPGRTTGDERPRSAGPTHAEERARIVPAKGTAPVPHPPAKATAKASAAVPQAPARTGPQRPAKASAAVPQAPAKTGRQTPGRAHPPAPGKATPRTPDPQRPGSATPQTPAKADPHTAGKAAPQTPAKADPQTAGKATPAKAGPGKAAPQTPAKARAQVPPTAKASAAVPQAPAKGSARVPQAPAKGSARVRPAQPDAGGSASQAPARPERQAPGKPEPRTPGKPESQGSGKPEPQAPGKPDPQAPARARAQVPQAPARMAQAKGSAQVPQAPAKPGVDAGPAKPVGAGAKPPSDVPAKPAGSAAKPPSDDPAKPLTASAVPAAAEVTAAGQNAQTAAGAEKAQTTSPEKAPAKGSAQVTARAKAHVPPTKEEPPAVREPEIRLPEPGERSSVEDTAVIHVPVDLPGAIPAAKPARQPAVKPEPVAEPGRKEAAPPGEKTVELPAKPDETAVIATPVALPEEIETAVLRMPKTGSLIRPQVPRPLDALEPERERRNRPRPNGLGHAPWILALSSLGVVLVALGYAGGRYDTPFAIAAYWIGQVVVFTPVVVRLLSRRLAGVAESFVLVLGLALNQYLLKWFYSPDQFRFPDELQHWLATTIINDSGELFQPNLALPPAVHFPGLAEMGAGVSQLTGLPVYAAGILVAGVAHLCFVGALFALVLRASGSPTIAGVSCVVYATTLHYLFFNSMYLYQTAALPFFMITIWAVRRWRAGAGWPFLAIAVVGIGLTTVSHHITAVALVATLVLLGITELIAEKGWPWRSLVAPLLSIVLVAAWVLLVARDVITYLEAPLDQIMRTASLLVTDHEDATTVTPSVSLWQLAVQGLGLVFLAWLFLALTRDTLARGERDSWRWSILAGTAVFFAGNAVRFLGENGPEIAGRLSTFTYVPISVVAAIALVHSPKLIPAKDDKGRRWLSVSPLPPARPAHRTFTPRVLAGATVITILMIGARVGGWPPAAQLLPGPYLAAGFERSVDAYGVASAQWQHETLGPGNRVGGDMVSVSLASTYGRQDPVREVGQLYYSNVWNSGDEELVDRLALGYLVVDTRLAEHLPTNQAYFEADPLAGRITEPLSPAQLGKFDELPTVSRLYDSGVIRIYHMGAS